MGWKQAYFKLYKDLIEEFIDDLDPECDHELIEKWEKRLKE